MKTIFKMRLVTFLSGVPVQFAEMNFKRPLTPSLSPSDGERVAEGRVRGFWPANRSLQMPMTLVAVAFIAASVNFVAASESDSDLLHPPSPQALMTGAMDSPQQAQQRRGRGGFGGGRMAGVYKSQVTANWFANNTKFWYRNDLAGEAREFILVDAERGTRTPAFDHAAVAKQMGGDTEATKLPVDRIQFSDDGAAVMLIGRNANWVLDLKSGKLSSEAAAGVEQNNAPATEETPERSQQPPRGRQRGEPSNRSPDGKWTAAIKEQNVFIRGADGQEIQLSTDGQEGNGYRRVEWAPDSQSLLAWRVEPGDRKQVHLVRSSPEGGGRAQLESRAYDLPGDKLPRHEPNLFDVATRKQIKVEVDRFEHGWLTPQVRWNRDGSRFSYMQVDRGHQRLRVIEVDPHSGSTRNLIDEKSDTFIWTTHTENLRLELVNWLEQTDEIIFVSEQDGWRHLYLVGAKDAKLRQITKGEWVIRGIERIDEDARQIWFSASGKNSGQDPYFLHHYRVNFDGSGLVALTDGNGNHTIEFSPDRKFLIATYSRPDVPPVNELRRVSDGKLVCKLEEADISELKSRGFQAPEVFVAKGRDGQTDIWGLIYRPRDFDPAKKYPLIEDIYAGPQGSFVPKSFGGSRYQSLTDLGFVVVKIDGMGTANRSKAFHDVCFKNLKDGGFADRILWMKAAAAKYAHLDITRVGVYGNSAGGQNAAAAVLFHPEFYKAAVASCGCHDNRMDKASWNEQWMGYMPGDRIWSKSADNWYSQSSNIDNAHLLQGKLFLIVGEMDSNVPPESTMRVVDALVRARKDFDLLVVPNGGHGMGGAYGQRRMEDFFVRHLQGIEPPNRNTGTQETPAGS
jgi:dipeptidyl aminopeptidase/acylaminoacyl peptidase